MDLDFLRDRLETYIRLWDEWRGSDSETDQAAALEAQILKLQPTALRIFAAYGEAAPSARNVDFGGWLEHRRAALRALGRLEDQDRLEQALAPTVPALIADHFHEWVWETAAPLWDSGHYRQAVATAAGNLSLKVQAKLDRWDVADDALVTEALSEKPP